MLRETTLMEMYPGLKIGKSGTFRPGIYETLGSDGCEVTADHLLLDFSGVVLRGGRLGGTVSAKGAQEIPREFSYDQQADPEEEKRVEGLGYYGTALILRNLKDVTVRGLSASGFELGVAVIDCENITLENCDFTGNFHDPDCGWNEHGPKGGIYLLRSTGCTVRGCRANQVWNGLYLHQSHDCLVENNDFSHVSNMCVKMWNACRNRIENNNLSWGLRIRPGEVHARDSAGLLMDSGCCHNVVRGNDLTHGGDGIFVRVLNGWHSSYNLFEDNDCSFANNNAIEAWANHNTYVRNKANDSSYGFWLGGSDFTVLQENEACRNGIGFANAPESFGNCGIAVVNGSGNGLRICGNVVCENYGPGIAARFEKGRPVFHWVLDRNIIRGNRTRGNFVGHGVYLKNAGNLVFSNNVIEDNEGKAVFRDSGTFGVRFLSGEAPSLRMRASFPETFVETGKSVCFSCDASCEAETQYSWTFGDQETGDLPRCEKSYRNPGSYYAGVTVTAGAAADLAGSVVLVKPRGRSLVWQDACLEQGQGSVTALADAVTLVSPDGNDRTLRIRLKEPVSLDGVNTLGFFLRQICSADTDWGRTVLSPVMTLRQDADAFLEITPTRLTSDGIYAEQSWEKSGYRYYELPLNGSEDFTVQKTGEVHSVSEIAIRIRHKNAGYLEAELAHAVLYQSERPTGSIISANPCPELCAWPKMISSGGCAPESLLDPNACYFYEETPFWSGTGEASWLGVQWNSERAVSDLVLYAKPGADPVDAAIEVQRQGTWSSWIPHTELLPGENQISVKAEAVTGIRVVFSGGTPKVWKLEAYGVPVKESGAVKLTALQFKTYTERDGSDSLSNLIVRLYRAKDGKPEGDPLCEVKIPPEKVEARGGINTLLLPDMVLEHGSYAAAFTQEKLAVSRTEGEYYRFPAASVSGPERSGLGTSEGWTDETETWGTLWLRAITESGVADGSHFGESMGPRAGFTGSEYRYQTFTL